MIIGLSMDAAHLCRRTAASFVRVQPPTLAQYSQWKGYWRLLSAILLICTADVAAASASAQDQYIRVGVILPLSGSSAYFGRPALDGIQYAADEIARSGGLNGKKIHLVWRDDQGSPALAKIAAKDLITDEHVDAILGAGNSACTQEIIPISAQYHIPLITPISSARTLSLLGSDWFFRLPLNDQRLLDGLLDFISGHYEPLTRRPIPFRAAVVYEKSTWGENLAADTRQLLATPHKYNFTITGYLPFDRDSSSETLQVAQQIARLDVDAVGCYVLSEDCVRIIRELKKNQKQYLLFGTDANSSHILLDGLGSDGDGFITLTNFFSDDSRLRIQDFITKFTIYKKSEQFEVNSWTAQGYDAARVLFNAIQGHDEHNHEQIRDAIRGTRGFAGLTGDITFDSHGEREYLDLVYLIADRGRFIPSTIRSGHVQSSFWQSVWFTPWKRAMLFVCCYLFILAIILPLSTANSVALRWLLLVTVAMQWFAYGLSLSLSPTADTQTALGWVANIAFCATVFLGMFIVSFKHIPTLRLLCRTEPYRTIAPLLFSVGFGRRRLFRTYLERLCADKHITREGSIYVPIPGRHDNSVIDEPTVFIASALKSTQRVAILGPGGVGKSTIVYKIIADHLAHQKLNSTARIPLLVSSITYSGNLLQAITNLLSKQDAWISDGVLESQLTRGHFIIFFDGITEIDPQFIDQLQKDIDAFAALYLTPAASNALIVTGRKALPFMTDEGWQLIWPQPLNDKTLPRFVKAYRQPAAVEDGLVERISTVCRQAYDSSYSPLLVKVALELESIPDPTGDLYVTYTAQLLRDKADIGVELLTRLVLGTYFVTKTRFCSRSQAAAALGGTQEDALKHIKWFFDLGILQRDTHDDNALWFFHDSFQSYFAARHVRLKIADRDYAPMWRCAAIPEFEEVFDIATQLVLKGPWKQQLITTIKENLSTFGRRFLSCPMLSEATKQAGLNMPGLDNCEDLNRSIHVLLNSYADGPLELLRLAKGFFRSSNDLRKIYSGDVPQAAAQDVRP